MPSGCIRLEVMCLVLLLAAHRQVRCYKSVVDCSFVDFLASAEMTHFCWPLVTAFLTRIYLDLHYISL
jgi:hypothetical protein